jgi:hypothetical protein
MSSSTWSASDDDARRREAAPGFEPKNAFAGRPFPALGDWRETLARWSIAPRGRWQAHEVAAIVVGFIAFWPAGLFLLGWKKGWLGIDRLMSRFAADPLATGTGNGGGDWRGDLSRSSGNSAFDAHKAEELRRLEEEYARLARKQRDFEAFLVRLREAKDREEFERFLREHQAVTPV